MTLLQKGLFKLMSSRILEENRVHHCKNVHSGKKSKTNEVLSVKHIKNTKFFVKESHHRLSI